MEVSLPVPAHVRRHLVEFLVESSSLQLLASPIVKYTALSFFADRFLPSLPCFLQGNTNPNWLLNPLRESNLQLFALISIWISSKIHDTRPLSVTSLKSLGDNLIVDQHFTTRDFAIAELVFMEVLRFEIGASQIAFQFLEDLLIQFRELSRIGELVSFHLCTEIMDLLYETEEISELFFTPYALAASVLVTAYVLSVPKQEWEFPVLPWVKFVTSYEEEDIGEMVAHILKHILCPKMPIQ
ncbi:cyclin-J18-like isoform X1 [Dioscorea cayenensis subsp. rotundata]|uniref:Cyclin-J18-like isoform X1 n=1 Tax=Dioscorea cayennensis subsp. rotundata TaxID=55577 RepID=A0AB40CXW2_DIOCR|nr:cyclin-J18-like isoform X1 [Dioscorea cayenensis subsp. rotundata]